MTLELLFSLTVWYCYSVFPGHTSAGEGTYFLHEYMIPRGSNAFCLYDTRGMSDDPSGNMRLLKHWMTKGVCHGELVKRSIRFCAFMY